MYMKPYHVLHDASSHLVGSPAQRAGSHDAYNTYLQTGRKIDPPISRDRGSSYSAFDVLVPPAAATTTSTTSTVGRVGGGVGVSLPLTVPPRQEECSETSSALVGTRDLQRGLLEQKLHHTQREAEAVREELKETGARLAQVTVRLNEQKVEFSALTHRYGAAVEKLTAAEASVRRLEEQLVQERRQHGALREERDGLKATLRELDWEAARLRRELQEERERPAVDPREVQRMFDDRSRFIPVGQVREMMEEAHTARRTVVGRLADALNELQRAHEEDETAVFVARSAVLSAATDLEAKLAAAEATFAALHDQLELFNEGSERDMTEMISSLIVENKELWQHLSKLKGDYDAATTQLTALRRKGEHVPHDKFEYTQKQLSLTTDKLTKAQKAVEAQIEMAKEHEEQMKLVMNSNETLQDRLRHLTEQLAQAQEELERRTQQQEENKTISKEANKRVEELQSLIESERRRLNNTVQQLNENFNSKEKEYEQHIRHLQGERNAAQEDAEQAHRELNDTKERLESIQRELDSRIQYFENYRQQSEEHQQQMNRSLQEEMNSARELLEHELQLARRGLEEGRTAIREAERERDDERAERHAAQAVATGLETELSKQRRENDQQQRRLEELTTRLQKLEAEANFLQQRRDAAEEESRQLQRELKRMQDRGIELERQLKEEREAHTKLTTQLQKEIRESERIRISTQEELKKVRVRLVEVEQQQQQYAPRESTEAEKENLMRENVRLHEQYQEVQQENVALRESMQQLRGKALNYEQISQQLEDLQERLRQLPALRQAAEDARRDAIRATEETEALRQERDAMSAKLDFFLEESKQAAKKDEEWGRVFRDAAEQARRLGSQVSMAKQQQQQQQRHSSVYISGQHFPTSGGYSEQYSNYQRVLGSKSSPPAGGIGTSPSHGQTSLSHLAVDSSPQPSAPTIHRPWR